MNPWRDLWLPLQPVLHGMECEGFPIDLAHVGAAAARADGHLQAALAELEGLTPGLNPNSAPQINAWLRGCGVAPSPVTKKGPARPGDTPSTDGAALDYLASHNPHVNAPLRKILEIRRIESGLKYLRKLGLHAQPGSDGFPRVHCSLSRAAATGRLGAARPEVQQIPKDKRKDLYGVRRSFVAAPGQELVVVDQSQLEMRLLAHYLLSLFGDGSLRDDLARSDCHSANALRVFAPLRPYLAGVAPEQVKSHVDVRVAQCRDDIKAVIYGMNYGKSDLSLGGTLRDEHGEPVGRAVARKVMDGVFSLYPSLRRYHRWVDQQLRERGGISTILGRFRGLPPTRRGWRQGINTPMQGGGADVQDLAVLAVARCPRLRSLGYRLILPVHDELVGQVPVGLGKEAGALVAGHFEEAGRTVGLVVPLVASVGVAHSWDAAH